MSNVKAIWRVTLANAVNTGVGTVSIANGGTYTTTVASGAVNNYSLGDNILTVRQGPATMEVKGNVVINGVDLEERLKTIEKVLMIPERDVILEQKHPKLKQLYNDYINALGKYRTFEAIKGNQNGTT